MRDETAEIVVGKNTASLTTPWGSPKSKFKALTMAYDSEEEILEILGPQWTHMYSFNRAGVPVKVFMRMGEGSKCSL